MKIIKIESCITCPYRAALPMHKGVARVPYCFKMGESKLLPYKLATKSVKPTAAPKNEIPDWCPLCDVELS